MSEHLKAEGTNDRPKIEFDKNAGTLLLQGRSLPEDAFTFYKPFIEWLTNYAATPAANTVLTVDLEYFNTASAKQIFKVVSIVNEIGKKGKAAIKWHYDKGDRDMLASGQRFAKLCSMEFEYIQNA
jgi:hypothetical protein